MLTAQLAETESGLGGAGSAVVQQAEKPEYANGETQTGGQSPLAESLNSSPRVMQQRALTQRFNNSPSSLQLKALATTINSSRRAGAEPAQREERPENPERIDLSGTEPAQRATTERTTQFEESSAQPNNTGLPDQLKSGVESLSGISLNDVAVHYNSSKPAQLGAHAYAQGTDIHVAPGQEQHLPHEAWHVAQQAQGRVQPTMQLKDSVPVNDDEGLENEADVMGARAAAMPAASAEDDRTEPSVVQGAQLQAKDSAGAPVQRRMGLELEFPIPVDPLGALSGKQKAALEQPLEDNEPRVDLQKSAFLDKTVTMFEGDGYIVRPDHQGSRLRPLMVKTPAQALSYNVLEFIFKPPVEALYEVEGVLDNIFDHVQEIGESTGNLTDRAQFNGDFYVGPINTDGETPDQLGLDAYSMQINFGIETQKIPDLFVAYAQSTDLSDKSIRAAAGEGGDEAVRKAAIYRDMLVKAASISATVEERFRKHVKAKQPLLGIRGILAVQALYLLMGSLPEEDRFGGTVKNFTPLLLKTSLSYIADYSLTPEEQELYAQYKDKLLSLLIAQDSRRSDETPESLLVVGEKGAKTGVKIGDLLTPKLDGPFVVPGAGISPDSVGGLRSGDDPSVRKKDKIPYPEYLTAPQRKPTEEEIEKYGPKLAGLLAPSSVESTQTDRSKEEENGRKRNRRRGGVFETRVADGQFTRAEAKRRAREMYMRVAILGGLDDEDMLTSKGQTNRTKNELGVE